MPKTVRRVFFFGILSFIAYPLSFAPIDLMMYGPSDTKAFFPMNRMSVFHPVKLLVLHTALAKPLLSWSDLWRVGDRHRLENWLRECEYTGSGHGGNLEPGSWPR